MPMKTKEILTGIVFGKLTVESFVPDNSRYLKWLCRCECGNRKVIMSQSFKRGATVSCGCYGQKRRSQAAKKHGESGGGTTNRSGTYSSWANMMMRCDWASHPSHKNYGAKGIFVCKRWHIYENFKADMGERPNGTSIDRIDNTKGYSLDNCRWATRSEQGLNKKNTDWVSYNGKHMPLLIFCNEVGIKMPAFKSRWRRRNKDYQAAINTFGINAQYLGKGITNVPESEIVGSGEEFAMSDM